MNWTPHKLLPIPTDEEIAVMEPEELLAIFSIREEAIVNESRDRFRYGFKFTNWKRLEDELTTHNEALVSGGNRSSKTQCGAYFVVKAAIENPGSRIICFCQDETVSLEYQQPAVYEWLPEEYKKKQTSAGTYISYSKKNGFTDNSLILPNGSQISFKYYTQFLNNPTILEGAELGSHKPEWLNIGAWLDEYLGSPDLIETLRFRLATRNSKMILTFTPIFGYTPTVNQYLQNAKPLERRPAELLGGEMIPTVMECDKINGTVHFFWTQDNPFAGYDRIKETLSRLARNEILIRAYGVPTKSYTTKFPKFSRDVNMISEEKMKKFVFGEIKNGVRIPAQVTLYQIIDPAGSKNWFMCWIAVDVAGTFYVYREWPGIDVGDWAVQGKNGKWTPGEGAAGKGYGLRDYIDAVREMEGATMNDAGGWTGGEEIFERLIDPRLSAATYSRADGKSSIKEDLDELDFITKPAPGDNIEDGLQKLIDKMGYDTTKTIEGLNRPHFYISEGCENIIRALEEYTGQDGLKEAWKDPIDVLRYAAAADIDHIEQKNMLATRQGKGY